MTVVASTLHVSLSLIENALKNFILVLYLNWVRISIKDRSKI